MFCFIFFCFIFYFKTSCAWRVPPAPHGRLERTALRMDKASAKMHACQVSGAKRGHCRQSLVRVCRRPSRGTWWRWELQHACRLSEIGRGGELSLSSSSFWRAAYDSLPSNAFDWHFVSSGSDFSVQHQPSVTVRRR